jgi:putative ABC transport system permease protein
VIGIVLSIALGRVLGSLPFAVGPVSVATLGPAVGLVVLVTLAGSLVPAWRASRVSPLAALREG